MALTIDIPGGEAVLTDEQGKLSPRRRREIEVVSSRIGRKLETIIKAERILVDGDLVDKREQVLDPETGEPRFVGEIDLSEHEFRLLGRLSDTIAWALLESWTLDLPLPATPDAFLDVPQGVFDAIREAAAKVNAEMGDGGFTVDALPEDPNEPADPSLPTSA